MRCPSDQQLHSFLIEDNALNDTVIVDHVGGCDTCQYRLEALTSEGPFATSAKLELPSYLSGLENTLAGASEPTNLPTPALPGYEILEVLGYGGMGVVYRARHLRLDREVALKVIAGGAHGSPDYRKRLDREGQLLAKLNYPGIVRIFDSGECDGLPYLELELITHGSLIEMRGHFHAPTVAVRLVEILARSTHVAHQQGIVHRDLKPANILLDLADENSTVADEYCIEVAGKKLVPKIADFGLSKANSDEGVADVSVSKAMIGTPQYMSPEQASEEMDRIGPATDIHALGVILFELLTGERPFDAGGSLDTLQRIRSHKPHAPSHYHPQVDRTLDGIVLKCLEKDPAHRFQSAVALADELERFRTQSPAATDQRQQGFCRNWRRMSLWLAGVVGVILAGLFIHVQTNRGLIVIKCVDPDLKITLQRNQEELDSFRVVDGTKELTVHAGNVQIGIPSHHADNYVVSESSFQLTRNDKKVVFISLRPNPINIDAPAANTTKEETPAWEKATQRQIAEWILSRGGKLVLASHPHYNYQVHTLPDEDVVISEVPRLSRLTSEEMKLFEYLPDLRKAGPTFGTYRGAAVGSLNHCRKLAWLNLNACRMTDAEFAHLDLGGVQYLGITYNKITGASLPKLAAATKLRHISMAGAISRSDEAALWFPKLSQLRQLDVYGGGDPAWAHLAKLPNLTYFKCCRSKDITDAGIAALLDCRKIASLEFFKVDFRAADLRKLQMLKTLKQVWFNQCQIADIDAKQLQELLPNCNVTGEMKQKQ